MKSLNQTTKSAVFKRTLDESFIEDMTRIQLQKKVLDEDQIRELYKDKAAGRKTFMLLVKDPRIEHFMLRDLAEKESICEVGLFSILEHRNCGYKCVSAVFKRNLSENFYRKAQKLKRHNFALAYYLNSRSLNERENRD